MGSTHGLALARQKTTTLAMLRPVQAPAAPTEPSVLSHLRPLSHTPMGQWSHGFARLDASGRIRDAQLFKALDWVVGVAIDLRLDDERVAARRGEGANHIDARGRLTIPEALRRALALDTGDGVLLSAILDEALLVITPVRCCDRVVCA